LCADHRIEFQIVESQNDSAGMISSTRIKRLIGEGDIESANDFLIEPYKLTGRVDHGVGRGRSLGAPTANLSEVTVQIPKQGVYGGFVTLRDGKCAAAIHIGPNPTFGESNVKIEVHLIDWQGELYDHQLHCFLLKRLREVRKFSSPDELRKQIAIDIEECRGVFGHYSK
jgi:riboflavin kinase/FMN adenylyltransferase